MTALHEAAPSPATSTPLLEARDLTKYFAVHGARRGRAALPRLARPGQPGQPGQPGRPGS